MTNAIFEQTEFKTVTFADNIIWDGTIFTDANMDLVHFEDACLHGLSLEGLDLTKCSLTNCDLSKTNLISAILPLECNLNGVTLDLEAITRTPNRPYIRVGHFFLPLPEIWSPVNVNHFINHISNIDSASLPLIINSLDQQYDEIKIEAMNTLISTLLENNAAISSIEVSLLDVIYQDPYLNDFVMKKRANEFMLAHLERFRCKVLPPLLSRQFTSYVNFFHAYPENMSKFSEFFTQITSQGMYHSPPEHRLTANQRNPESNIQPEIIALYDKYLQQSDNLRYAQSDDFGDSQNKPDWAASDACNYLLHSATQDGRVILLSEDSFHEMLYPSISTRWMLFYLYQEEENVALAQHAPKALFEQCFPLLHHCYQSVAGQLRFNALINILAQNADPSQESDLPPLGSLNIDPILMPPAQLIQLLRDATKKASCDTKLITPECQQALVPIFGTVIQQGKLKPHHFDQISVAYHLQSSDNLTISQTLFSLATVFVNLSSSAIFGTETESPTPIRHYACALLDKAHETAPEVMGSPRYLEYRGRLLALPDPSSDTHQTYFSCTSILFAMMSEYGKQHFPEIINTIIPLPWG